MKKPSSHLLAKIAAWSMFGLTAASHLSTSGLTFPSGTAGWMQFITTLLTALAVHQAASTDGVK